MPRFLRSLFSSCSCIRAFAFTDAGSELDDRNPIANPINDLNQVIQKDAGGDGWIYSWDDNGNMTGKDNGVDAWIYS